MIRMDPDGVIIEITQGVNESSGCRIPYCFIDQRPVLFSKLRRVSSSGFCFQTRKPAMICNGTEYVRLEVRGDRPLSARAD